MTGGARVLRGRWVIVDAADPNGIVEDASVVVERGRVAFVGRHDEATARAPEAEVLGDGTQLIVPGLVNTHHHGRGLSSFQLGVLDDRLEPWLIDWRGMKPLDAYTDTAYAAMQLIRSGVTTVLHSGVARDLSRYAEESRAHLRAYEDAGIRVSYGVQILDEHLLVDGDEEAFVAALPCDLARQLREVAAELGGPTPADFTALFTELVARYADHPRVKVLAAPVGPDWCSDALLRQVADQARDAGAGLHLHCLESPFQRYPLSRRGESGAVARLRDVGIAGPDVSIAHGVWLRADEARICAEEGTTVCHNASSNLRLRSGIAPLNMLRATGVHVTIGTDGITLADDEDMLAELRLVAKLHRLPHGLDDSWAPTSAEVLTMATRNAGRPTLWGDDIGTLTPGSLADVAMIDLEAASRPYVDPAISPLDVLLYRARAEHVRTVLVGGDVVYRDGVFTQLNEAEICRQLASEAVREVEPRLARWRDAMCAVRPYVAGYYRGRADCTTESKSSYTPNGIA